MLRLEARQREHISSFRLATLRDQTSSQYSIEQQSKMVHSLSTTISQVSAKLCRNSNFQWKWFRILKLTHKQTSTLTSQIMSAKLGTPVSRSSLLQLSLNPQNLVGYLASSYPLSRSSQTSTGLLVLTYRSCFLPLPRSVKPRYYSAACVRTNSCTLPNCSL